MSWYTKVLKQYADFSGRARRKEYWMFAFINLIIGAIFYVLTFMLGMMDSTHILFVLLYVICCIYGLAIFIPNLAVTVRRLHDTNRSGFWVLITFVPFVGGIILLVFMLIEGTPGNNEYGPDPKNDVELNEMAGNL